jgi:hypothetical protein
MRSNYNIEGVSTELCEHFYNVSRMDYSRNKEDLTDPIIIKGLESQKELQSLGVLTTNGDLVEPKTFTKGTELRKLVQGMEKVWSE